MIILDLLQQVGFKMTHDKEFGSSFGTIKPETYNVGKNHFKPDYRFVYVSSAMYPNTSKNFYYVTSNIVGQYREYRHQEWFENELGNIFASGKTRNQAILEFVNKFKTLSYNLSHNLA